jgi:phosphomannomutase
VIGGEGNGGVIDLRVSPIRDSLVAIALVLQLMAETGKSVGQLSDGIGGYCMRKDKFAADQGQAREILEVAKEAFADARLDESDGCRFDFADGWVHIRTSNTEPVMRVIVEAQNKEAAEKYCSQIAKISSEIAG